MMIVLAYLNEIKTMSRSPGEGNGYPLQYSYLENLMHRGAWWAPVQGVAKSRMWLSDWHFHFTRSQTGKPNSCVFSLTTIQEICTFCSNSFFLDRLLKISLLPASSIALWETCSPSEGVLYLDADSAKKKKKSPTPPPNSFNSVGPTGDRQCSWLGAQ